MHKWSAAALLFGGSDATISAARNQFWLCGSKKKGEFSMPNCKDHPIPKSHACD
jgi:hypothetical protein